MKGALYVGVDASTTACKAVVYDAQGNPLAEGRAPVPLENPSPGAWEQDPATWSAALEQSLSQVTSALGVARVRDVVALAIAAQRETFVVTDPAFVPLAPAIVWMDTRADREVDEVVSAIPAERIHDLSGKVPCTTPSLYKLRLLLRRLRPDLAPLAKRVSDVHAYLVRHLTGEHVTALSAADPMGLVDMRARAWSEALCDAAGVLPSDLPRLVPSGEPIATLLPDVAQRTGLPPTTRVVAGTGDGQAAALGAGIAQPGAAYLNVGTAVVMGTPLADYTTSRGFRTLFSPLPGGYFAESDLKSGTFTLDWLSDRLLGGKASLVGGDERAGRLAHLERLAESIPAGSGGLYCVPYLQGVMNPHWNDRARGAFVGLTGDHAAQHLYRAILEGLAFEQRLALEPMEEVVGAIGAIVCMGGALGRPLVRSILASALGRRLTLAKTGEATALGAGVLAAIGDGRAIEEAAGTMTSVEAPTRVDPGPEKEAYDALYPGYRLLYPALASTGIWSRGAGG